MTQSHNAVTATPVNTPEHSHHSEALALVTHIAQGGTLDTLLERGDCDDEAVYSVGHQFYRQARYEDALRVFAWLVMRNNLERRFIYALAACLQMLGRHESAIQHYLNASLLNPDDPLAVFHACECLIALGRVAQAREGLVLVLELSRTPEHESIRKKGEGLIELIDRQPTSPTQGSKNDHSH